MLRGRGRSNEAVSPRLHLEQTRSQEWKLLLIETRRDVR